MYRGVNLEKMSECSLDTVSNTEAHGHPQGGGGKSRRLPHPLEKKNPHVWDLFNEVLYVGNLFYLIADLFLGLPPPPYKINFAWTHALTLFLHFEEVLS